MSDEEKDFMGTAYESIGLIIFGSILIGCSFYIGYWFPILDPLTLLIIFIGGLIIYGLSITLQVLNVGSILIKAMGVLKDDIQKKE